MDIDMRPDDLVAPLRTDVLSGASEVASRAAEVVRGAALRLPAASRQELRSALEALGARVLAAQPAMAQLLALMRDVLAAVEAAGSTADARRSAAAAAHAFREGLEARTRAVAERAAGVLPGGGLVPAGGLIGTISSSGTVRAALVLHAAGHERPTEGRGAHGPPVGGHPQGAGGRQTRVLCFESRPLSEGRTLAEALARAGIAVTYAVDAATHSLVPSCDVVLLGADSIGDRGIVNKIGSAALAHAARAADVPVYVLADETKILPHGFPQPLDDDRPAVEVWPAAPAGVSPWNRYFEAVPAELVTGVVTESATLAPAELERLRSGVRLPDALRAWAEGRARPAPRV